MRTLILSGVTLGLVILLIISLMSRFRLPINSSLPDFVPPVSDVLPSPDVEEPNASKSSPEEIKDLFFREFIVEFSSELSSAERQSRLSEIREYRKSLMNETKKEKQ